MFYLFLIHFVYSNNCAFRTLNDCVELNNINPYYYCVVKNNRCVLLKKNSDKFESHLPHKNPPPGMIRSIRERMKNRIKGGRQRRQQEFSDSDKYESGYDSSESNENSYTEIWDNQYQGDNFENENLPFEDEEICLDFEFVVKYRVEEEPFFQVKQGDCYLFLPIFCIMIFILN